MASLHHVVEIGHHVVPEVIEPELVVRPVGDIGGVGGPTILRGHLPLDQAGRHTKEAVDLPHPLGVPLGEVVVHGDEVHAFFPQGVQVDRKRPRKGLALPRAHLCDPSCVKSGPAHELDIEVTLPDDPRGGLPHHGERLRKEAVDVLTLLETALELARLGTEGGIVEDFHVVLQGVHLGYDRLEDL